MISNSEELSLLAAILITTNATADLVALLRGEALRSVTEQDWLHVDTLLLTAVENGLGSADAEKILGRMLDGEAGPSRDDRVWSLLVGSSTIPESRHTRLEQIDSMLTKEPQHRQALLAKIAMLASSTGLDGSAKSKLLQACHEYFKIFGSKTFCFDDLIERLRIAGLETINEFHRTLEHEPDSSRPSIRDLFLLKLEYHVLCKDDLPPRHFSSFARRALELYFEGTLSRLLLRQLCSCLLYTSPSPRDGLLSRMPSSA